MTIIYKIRHKGSKLFSSGGADPSFNEQGKPYKTYAQALAAVRVHRESIKNKDPYSLRTRNTRRDRYKNCEIVEFSLVENKVISLTEKKSSPPEHTKKEFEFKLAKERVTMNTIKCDYCDADHLISAVDPYEQEMSSDPESIKESHFVCGNSECNVKFEEALRISAEDV